MALWAPDWVLYQLARRWPLPRQAVPADAPAAGTRERGLWYARRQFAQRVVSGIPFDPRGMDVLEIGCGPGGIACFIASVGARRVVGLELSASLLADAAAYREELESQRGGVRLPVEFVEGSALEMPFEPGTFDIVYADNAFEHFTDPEQVLRECARVLRPGGRVVVPTFSSIWSKYGLHLKNGLRVPWANLVFSEETILRALRRMAEDDPRLFDYYPGLRNDPRRVRDVRAHGDLNDITYAAFREMAARTGFVVERFRPLAVGPGRLLARVPGVRTSPALDVLSVAAEAVLRKPEA
jgi:ubiquinone/menaquinone biosynthesis C-methylase UbiE